VQMVCDMLVEGGLHPKNGEPKHLLWTLYFLKCHPKEGLVVACRVVMVIVVVVAAVARRAVAVVVDVVVHRAIAIIVVDFVVSRVVWIVVFVVARRAIVVVVALCAVAIIVDNGKTPAHRHRQRRHHDKGNNAIATTAKTPAHQRRRHHRDEGHDASSTTARCLLFLCAQNFVFGSKILVPTGK
jgi:hypothetical protein